MKKNVGYLDRVVRIVVGSLFCIIGFLNTGAVFSLVFIIVGSLLFLTGVFSRCALYNLFHLNTHDNCSCCKDKNTCDDCSCCKDDGCKNCDVKEDVIADENDANKTF